MAISMFTKTAETQLRAAGWFPGRFIPTSATCSERQSASQALREFGQLSLRSRKSQVLEFGPGFESGPETEIPHRVISNSDVSIAEGVWEVVGADIGFQISNVAWEQGQDVHAIAVDHSGLVYCATWRITHGSRIADADVMKLADSMNAYLNYWLDPSNETRRGLHAECPTWYMNVKFPLDTI